MDNKLLINITELFDGKIPVMVAKATRNCPAVMVTESAVNTTVLALARP